MAKNKRRMDVPYRGIMIKEEGIVPFSFVSLNCLASFFIAFLAEQCGQMLEIK